MAWWDTFQILGGALGNSRGVQLGTTAKPFATRMREFGVETTAGRKQYAKPLTWSDLASGSFAEKPRAYTPAGPPERFDIKWPLSSTKPGSPYGPPEQPTVSTEGDLVGSFVGAGGSTISELTLANYTPWLMERVNVLANDLAASVDNPVIGAVASGVDFATDHLLDGVMAVSGPIGDIVFEAFPTWVRDNQLNDRAKLYRAIARGEGVDYGIGGPVSDPLATVGQVASLFMDPAGSGLRAQLGLPTNMLRDLTGETVSDMARQVAYWRSELEASTDPNRRLTAEQQIAVLRDSIDLPESLKSQIERDPGVSDENLEGWLGAMPEGKNWSYEPGFGGFSRNAANTIAFYLAEAMAGKGLLTWGARQAALTGVPSVMRGAKLAAGVGSQTLRIATAATAVGAATVPITTTMHAVARYTGNEEAIAWFDNANRSTEFSDDPMTQLVTGFAVSPIAAARMLKNHGVLPLRSGGGVAVNAVLRDRLLRHYDDETLIVDMTRRMFKLGSADEARLFLAEEKLGDMMPDRIVGAAMDIVLDRLPRIQRLAWIATHSDPVERTTATLQRWGQEALDLIQRDPDLVATRFHTYDWQRRMSLLPFNAHHAAKVARDFRGAEIATFDLRAKLKAVVGFRESLPPEAQSLARTRLDQVVVDGMVNIDDVTGLVVDFPVLRKFLAGKIKSTDRQVPRAAVDRMLDEATSDWNRMARHNPTRAATGEDPVLRPDSPAPMREAAAAYGTSVDVIRAIDAADLEDVTGLGAVKQFLRDKLDYGEGLEVDRLAPEAVYERAARYLDDTGGGWRRAGTRRMVAEQELARLQDELIVYRTMNTSAARDDAVVEVERQIYLLRDLIGVADDRATPFAMTAANTRSAVRFLAKVRKWKPGSVTDARRQELWNYLASRGKSVQGSSDDLLARVKADLDTPTPTLDRILRDRVDAVVDARERLDQLDRINVEFEVMGAPQMASLFNKVQGQFKYSGGLPSISQAMRARLVGGLQEAGERGWAAEASFASDYDLWRLILRHQDSAVIRKGLTSAQKRMIERVDRNLGGRFPKGADDYASAWRHADDFATSQDEAWMEAAGRLLHERDGLLGGRSPIILEKIAGAKMPLKFMEEVNARAQAGQTGWSWIDPEFAATVHPRNLSRLRVAIDEALDNPSQAARNAVRDIIDGDDILREQIYNSTRYKEAVKSLGTDPFDWDPAAADQFLRWVAREAIPADFQPKALGLIEAETELDQLIRGRNVSATAEAVRASAAERSTTTGLLRRATAGTASPTIPKGANRVPPPYEKAPAFTADQSAELVDWKRAKQASVKSYADPEMVGFVERQANGAPVQIDEALPAGRFSAVVSPREGPAGRMIGREVSAFGSSPDEALEALSAKLPPIPAAGAPPAASATAEAVRASATTRSIAPLRVPRGDAAKVIEVAKGRRASVAFRRKLSEAGADMTAEPNPAIVADAANRTGIDVISVLNHGTVGTRPATLRGVLGVLEQIENGNGARLGIGQGYLAEGQRVAKALLDDATKDAVRAARDPNNVGLFRAVVTLEDEAAVAEALDAMMTFDDANPLGTLQYGLTKPPSDAIIMEYSRVAPGLVEELLSRRFQPYDERVWVSQGKRAFDFLFGKHSNQSIMAGTKSHFIERSGRQGVSFETATAIWDDWMLKARQSRSATVRRAVTGEYEIHSGDTPLYAGVSNIPDKELQRVVHGSADAAVEGTVTRLLRTGKITLEEADMVKRTDWSTVYRESASFVRRHLADSKIPLGKALANTYGLVAHNKWVTMAYFLFRFGLDIRYHAMNYLEAQILYYGRAGLRKGEIDQGRLGMTEGYLRNLDMDPVTNTGYPFSRDRMAMAYKTFLKEQPDALRKGVLDVATEKGDEWMAKVWDEIVRTDPQIRDMVRTLDGTIDPEQYVKAMDDYYGRMLNNVDGIDDAKIIDQELADAMLETPHLSEMFDHLGRVNKDLWDNVRGTFYGNPNRSRAERFLNSYLLYWPLSYQIKSTKWFAGVLFDRAGGIKTNALGAYTFNDIAETHNRLLATDAEYRDWFEKHDTAVFAAQMFFPVDFEGTGVSLNPALRSMFFDRSKAFWDIGPIYTFGTLLPGVAEEVYADLYPTFGDYLRGPYRALTGRNEPRLP